jgi:hypothetical protein
MPGRHLGTTLASTGLWMLMVSSRVKADLVRLSPLTPDAASLFHIVDGSY